MAAAKILVDEMSRQGELVRKLLGIGHHSTTLTTFISIPSVPSINEKVSSFIITIISFWGEGVAGVTPKLGRDPSV